MVFCKWMTVELPPADAALCCASKRRVHDTRTHISTSKLVHFKHNQSSCSLFSEFRTIPQCRYHHRVGPVRHLGILLNASRDKKSLLLTLLL